MILRTLILLLLWALPAQASINWNGAAITSWNGATITAWNGVAVAPADDYSDITFWWTCENANIGASDYSSGDTTASLGSGAAINTDANASGTNGLDLPTAGDYAQFAISSADLISRAEGSLMVKFRYNATPGTNVDIFKATVTGSAITVESSGTDEMRVAFYADPANATLATDSANLTTGTWYLVIVRWKPAANARFIGIYDASDGSLIDSAEDLSTSYSSGTSNYTVMNIGDNGANTQDTHVDQIVAVSSSYLRDWLALRTLTESPR